MFGLGLTLDRSQSAPRKSNRPVPTVHAVDIRSDGHGLRDNPTFINDIYNWFVTDHGARSIYLIDDARDNSEQGIHFLLTDGHFPKSSAAFRADFG